MALGQRQAADAQRHGHVVQRTELRQQVVELVDKPQVLVAQLPLALRRQRRHLFALQAHRARRGCIQPAQQVQQGALAR
eukprot:gene22980-28056_t